MKRARKQNQTRPILLAASVLLLTGATVAAQAGSFAQITASSASFASALPLVMAAGLAFARTNKAHKI